MISFAEMIAARAQDVEAIMNLLTDISIAASVAAACAFFSMVFIAVIAAIYCHDKEGRGH